MSGETISAVKPSQGEMPFAIVQGAPFTELPQDLYIPPEALEVILDAFEGPLDLLLYLIKRQNLDILDIPIAEITGQYMQYIELMREMKLDLAAEYLVMAAMLAEIKSRMLLPKPSREDEDEDDPRAELVRRLQEYERYKTAAEDLERLPRLERDLHRTIVAFTERKTTRPPPRVELEQITRAICEVMRRAELYSRHSIRAEPLSVRERMTMVLDRVRADRFTAFTSLFDFGEGRSGVVVALLAILELTHEHLIEMVQNEPAGAIYVKAVAA